MSDLIYRQDVIELVENSYYNLAESMEDTWAMVSDVEKLPSAQSERLSDDDFETIRIHLNAYKEKLCNQQRWEEAEEYQRIIDRFTALVSAEPERKKGKWIDDGTELGCCCSECGTTLDDYFDGLLHEICLSKIPNFCPNCGCQMER